MIPLNIECSKCGANFSISSYRKFTVCPYCGEKTPFEGFAYSEINRRASKFASVKWEMDCPSCRSPHMFLYSLFGKWRCVDCAYTISNFNKMFGVFWFCDSCDAYMNIQDGFTTKDKVWTCTECGFKNSVTKDDIL